MRYSLAIIALMAAVSANPVALPQAVTAAIPPPDPAPPGCSSKTVGSFGIAVHRVGPTSAPVKRDVVEEVCDEKTRIYTMAPVSQIIDGQIQGGHPTLTVTKPCPTTSVPVVTEAPDAQPQVPTSSVPVVTEAPDAQPQVPTSSVPVVSQAPDAQPQVPTSSAPVVSQAPDAQPQAPTSSALPPPPPENPTSAPEAPVKNPPSTPEIPSPAITPSSSSTTGVAAASTPKSGMKACHKDGALAITLEDGILKDQQGRTGYIAANYQFQFDGPPQAGAIYTSGFTICNNGSLALGGSNVFYECLSGDFYNLYDRYWAAQCNPVTINAITLEKC